MDAVGIQICNFNFLGKLMKTFDLKGKMLSATKFEIVPGVLFIV